MKRLLEENTPGFKVEWFFIFRTNDAQKAGYINYPALAEPVHGVFFQTPASIFQPDVCLMQPREECALSTVPSEVSVLMVSQPHADCAHFPDGTYHLEEREPGVFLGFPDSTNKRAKKLARELEEKQKDEPAPCETPFLRVTLDPETHIVRTMTLLSAFFTDANRAFMLAKSAELMPVRDAWLQKLEAAERYDCAAAERDKYAELIEKAEEELKLLNAKVNKAYEPFMYVPGE